MSDQIPMGEMVTVVWDVHNVNKTTFQKMKSRIILPVRI